MPSHLAYAPDSSIVFVSLQETDRLVAIDLKHLAILWNQPVGKTPAGVLWLNGKVLVADMGDRLHRARSIRPMAACSPHRRRQGRA